MQSIEMIQNSGKHFTLRLRMGDLEKDEFPLTEVQNQMPKMKSVEVLKTKTDKV